MAANLLELDKVQEGVANLLKILESKNINSKKLLPSTEPVFLQIEFVKIPKVKKIIARIPLVHSLLTEESEVCFIPADLIRGRKVNHELTVNHYTKLLKKRGVSDVQKIQIIPSRQIRVEYCQYEARRKLCNMFDIFLIDNKISHYLFRKLGKTFDRARKWPIPIRVKRKNLKDEILSKLKKTSMALDDRGLVKTVQVGHVNMTAEEISENILSVSNYIRKYFPAGWANIRSLHIKGLRSAALPIFMSLISPNDVPVPKFKRKKKKSVLAIDELSTIGKKVSVYRCGKVVVHHSRSDDDLSEVEEEAVGDIQPKSVEEDELSSIGRKRSRKRKQAEGKMLAESEELFTMVQEKEINSEEEEGDDDEGDSDDDNEDASKKKRKVEMNYLFLRKMEEIEQSKADEEKKEQKDHENETTGTNNRVKLNKQLKTKKKNTKCKMKLKETKMAKNKNGKKAELKRQKLKKSTTG